MDHPWRLVYQSRSGAPHIPWLEPDICDHLEERHAAGVPAVVMVPIGFVSDHMEVMYDLDTEATAKAAELGLPVAAPPPSAPTRGSPPPSATSSWSAPPPSAARAPDALRPGRPRPRATTCARSAAARRAHRSRPPPAPTDGPATEARAYASPPRSSSKEHRPTAAPTPADRPARRRAERRTARPRPGGRPPRRRPAARRPPRRPRGGRHQVQPDRRRHRDGPRLREADHRLPGRAPPRRRLPRRGGRQLARAPAASAGSSTRVDGTVNYLYGLPRLVGLHRRRARTASASSGSSRAPMRGETYQAVARQGAYSNGERLRVPPRAAARPGAGRHRLRLRRRAPGRPGGRGARTAARRSRHPAGRLGRDRPVRCGLRPARRATTSAA